VNLQYVNEELRGRITDFMNNPTVSYWLKKATEDNLNRDCIDALRDAKDLVYILEDVASSMEE
jgi:hypothetical protein